MQSRTAELSQSFDLLTYYIPTILLIPTTPTYSCTLSQANSTAISDQITLSLIVTHSTLSKAHLSSFTHFPRLSKNRTNSVHLVHSKLYSKVSFQARVNSIAQTSQRKLMNDDS